MNFIGLDTETINGYCRLIGLSNKESFNIYSLDDMILFLNQRNGENFLAYNADYDAQAILKWLPKKELHYIMLGLEIDYANIKFLYYKKKFLKFNNNWLFDVYQYYHAGTLTKAAKKFLNRKTVKLDTKIFIEETIYLKKTIDCCISDATLAYQLFMKMYQTLPKELLEVKPISTAFYAAKYFKRELLSNRIDRKTNLIARCAYHGGKFEIFTKGKFGDSSNNTTLYNYDIVSAYPAEICKLRSMNKFSIVRHKDYISDAAYSLFHVRVDIPGKFISPLVYKYKGLCLYPVGKYEGVITKKEFEHIKEYDPEIISAYHIFTNTDTPFKNRMEKVFERKCNDENKIVWKYLANSLYGKTAAATKRYDDKDLDFDVKVLDTVEKDGKYYYKVEDITKSNFVFASEITANVRLRMYDQIKKYGDKIIAVQTDSLVSSIPLDLEINKDKLGAWTCTKWNEAYMIGSGVYFYRIDKVWYAKYRGFNFSDEEDEEKKVEKILNCILESDKLFIEFDLKRRISIQEANRTHKPDMANIIVDVIRKLNINFDKKRIWLNKWNSGKELQTKQIPSLAIFLKDFAGQAGFNFL